MREFTERFGNVAKRFGRNENGSATKDSGESGELPKCTGHGADFAQGAAHSDQTSSDFAPVVLREISERFCDVAEALGRQDHANGRGKIVLTKSSEQTGDGAHLGEGTAHGGKALTDLLPAHSTKLFERICHHFDRLSHGDERTGGLNVDLGVAQPLGGSDELRHGAAHTGETLADLIPIEVADRGHGVGQHVHGLREFHEGRTGLNEIGGLDALHRLRDRFKTNVKLSHQAADGRDATNDFTATEGGDLLHRVNKQRDGSGDLHQSKSLDASSERVERFLKTTQDIVEDTSTLLEILTSVTKDAFNGLLDLIECSTKLLRGKEDATSGEAGEDVASGDVIRDPRQDVTDDVLDPFERPAEYVTNR